MTESKKIREYLQSISPGKPFSAKVLFHLGSATNIRQVLTRLVKTKELHRVARGVFIRPKVLKGVGEALPSIQEIAQVMVEANGETLSLHAAEAARQLHLTTQVPLQTVYYTNGTSRTLKIGARRVQLKHVSPRKLKLSGTLAGTVMAALSYIGREHVTAQTIGTLKNRLPANEFAAVLQQTNFMPAWMADCFHSYQRGRG